MLLIIVLSNCATMGDESFPLLSAFLSPEKNTCNDLSILKDLL